MKKLEQLGISPSPWKYIGYHYHRNGEYIHLGEVWVKGGKHKIVVDISQPDASLIAAAPKLYEACYEMLRYYYEQNKNTTVFNTALELMKQAVAEAAGESEVKDNA